MDLSQLVQMALSEDMPYGDVTTDALKIDSKHGQARVVAKEDLVISGMSAFNETVHQVSPETEIKWHFEEGAMALEGQTLASLRGNLIPVLKAERVALNFLGHLSGIATYTRCFVEKLKDTDCKIIDTRKTTPLLRRLEKQAVVHGRGHNHRMNLSDAILIKENHVQVAGSLRFAIEKVRAHSSLPVEVECQSLEDVEQAMELKVERVMLDNMDIESMQRAIKIIPVGVEIEASGNMTLERIAEVAHLGVQFISVGAITHSAPSADLSLLFDWEID